MKESIFNLWHEPWICVLTKKNQVKEVSLEDILVNAHEYVSLAGELPTQDFAILRLLLALLHTIFYRKSPEDPWEAWYELWIKKQFPKPPIIGYKSQWYDRFFLFDSKHPFYQEPNIPVKDDKTKPIEKLNGEISESDNKARLFLVRNGNEKSSLSYAEAARWLVHNNCYDDTSLKNPSPKLGWCGQLWGIFAVGNNLFETLMLNLILWKDALEPWNDNKPYWENKNNSYVSAKLPIESYEIGIPDNPAELYTIQSRYVLLQPGINRVISYKARSGVWFSQINAFSEQLTLWTNHKDINGEKSYQPKGLDKSTDKAIQIWREFSSIMAEDRQDSHSPGIINWIASLRDYLDKDYFVRFQTVAIAYDKNVSSIDNVYSDSLGLHIDILTTLGKNWRNIIYSEVSRCKKIADILGRYSDNIQKSAGLSEEKNLKGLRENICKQFYYQIDIPFRNWISKLDPNNYDGQKAKEIENWHKISINIAKSIGESLINETGGGVWINRIIDDKKGCKTQGRKKYYSIPMAFNIFLTELNKVDGWSK